MKSNHKIRKTPLALISAALVIGLTACGDDVSLSNISGISNSSTDNFNMAVLAAPSGAATGVLGTKVAGVSYSASSGKSGITDEDGTFEFNHGDTIEFKLGGLDLGKVPASPVVTPVTLADGNENKLQNILILFQSLDSDGDPSNGISITAETAEAINKSINLAGDPDKFASAAKLQEIIENSEIDGAVKTAEEANTSFLSQSTTMLGGKVWVRYNDRVASMVRIASDGSGEYVQGQASPDDSCNINRVCAGRTIFRAGVEYGILSAPTVNASGFTLSGETTVDTNLRAGFSDPDVATRITSDGYELVLSDIVNVQLERETPSIFSEIFHIGGASSTVRAKRDAVPQTEVVDRRFKRVENDPSGIVGAWAFDNDTLNTRTFMFFPDGKFFLVDPTGDTQLESQADCAQPGVEFANYTYNKGSNQLSISGFTYNTDGCAGLSSLESNAVHKFTISSDGDTAKLEKQGEEAVTVYRISG
ncbi:MAG: adhesin [Nitrosomonas sp.]|nr:adhesin [Nitrosomonas sp.]